MSRDYSQSPQEVEAQLAEQLDHIQTSADRFDRGVHSEAKRLAVAIRILVHDHGQSRSVLGQLGRKDANMFDSAIPYDPDSITEQWGLLVMTAGGRLPAFVAPLDFERQGAGRWVDFETWWRAIVFRDAERREITRAGLVLAVADQDGGAHVDPSLESAYAALSRQNSLGWFTEHSDGSKSPADPPHLHAVRQVAHEILKTLVPGYAKQPHRPPGTVFAWGFGGRPSTPEE